MKNRIEKVNDLAFQLKNGDRSCFNEFYKLTFSKAFSTAYRLCGNKFDAEDIVQESYMILLSRISSLQKTESVQSWFGRIVANKSRDYMKKKKPVLFSNGEERDFDVYSQPENDYSVEETYERAELNEAIRHEIDSLPEEKRRCVIMKYYDDLTVTQISEIIGIPVSTAKNRLWTARKDLMNMFAYKKITVA
ncbi:MAG: sigma-70 family RNA polymerase sigma factor [Clostridia bacterium]|nr:sigma-70 family RNA polymerase sigma factor [Clostridia bacterium]